MAESERRSARSAPLPMERELDPLSIKARPNKAVKLISGDRQSCKIALAARGGLGT